MRADSASPTSGSRARDQFPVRARHLLKVRAVWAFPLVLASIVVVLITAFYISSVVDPLAHLHGLPVQVVDEDQGATIGSQRIDFGQKVQAGLTSTPAVSNRLGLVVSSLPAAEQAMDRDAAYATVVIPPDFTASLLAVAGLPVPGAVTGRPRIEILTNERAGTLGVSLATGVLQPALAAASIQIGRSLTPFVPAGASSSATRTLLASPVTVTAVQYRPLPAHSALGLSAFYVALLTMMCGLLGGIIVNASVDGALGYATTEFGPRWRQRQPLPINRWQTLLLKWTIAAVVTAVMTGLLLAVAAGALGMDAPYPALLWLYIWFCAASVAAGTLVLYAVLGTPGQMLALLLFVYAGLASAGGTVPVEALPTPLRWLADVEPLRQILEGTRSIMYFDARLDAGLGRGLIAAGAGLVLWLVVGTVAVRWYDRKRQYRMDPELLAYVGSAVEGYRAQRRDLGASSTDSTAPPAGTGAEHSGSRGTGSGDAGPPT